MFGPSAQVGDPPATVKSTLIPSAAASRTIVSHRVQFAAGYAFGSVALNFGIFLLAGLGAIEYQNTTTRTVFAPRARISASVPVGSALTPTSWMIWSWVLEALAAAGRASEPAAISDAESVTAEATRASSRVVLREGVGMVTRTGRGLQKLRPPWDEGLGRVASRRRRAIRPSRQRCGCRWSSRGDRTS